ncbi:hypothetical protein BGZ73_002958 [Actinomortierella ambigua]|nr:hypothetical protein BGZ73_002958 [Actinomortierella ambigua]
MVDYRTVGTYRGPQPDDPNAELRKLFTVPENQQDGLASILHYIQQKVGFTVGSTDTKPFQKVLNDEFPDILIYRPASYRTSETKKPIPTDQIGQTNGSADVGVTPLSTMTRSLIEFITKMDGRDLTLDIAEEHTLNSNGFEVELTDRNAWEVNRSFRIPKGKARKMTTVGVYSGPPPSDTNAAFLKVFTDPANQQDGLASILKYAQEKVGFTVGSTNTIGIRLVLTWEFSNIFLPHWDGILQKASGEKGPSLERITPEGVRLHEDHTIQSMYIPPSLPAYLQFLKDLTEGSWTYKSLVVFSTKDEGGQLSLTIDENHVVCIGSQQSVNQFSNRYIVDRDAMVKNAQWLVDKLKFKDSLDEWNRRITSPGY